MAVASNEKVVFEQEDVFVHTAVPTSTFYDNIIRGKLCIVEHAGQTFIHWMPITDISPSVDFEVHPLHSGEFEYGVVTTQDSSESINQPSKTTPNTAAGDISTHIRFSVMMLHSIRRSDPRLAWSYAVFILKDGSTQPALHFHSGGIKNMISSLQRYIWLTRSPLNLKLYIVQEKADVMDSNLNQLELFSESPGDAVSKFFNSAYYGTLSRFSKVTQYVVGGMGQSNLEARRPITLGELADKEEEQEFEMLESHDPDFGPVIPVARGQPLQPEEWCAFMDDEGRIKDVERLQERIFRGGIHDDIKREAWKFLLGYFSYSSTYQERAEHQNIKKEEYLKMKNQWQSLSPIQLQRFTEFASRKHSVEKDAIRTDRNHPFYKGDDNKNVKVLSDILITYCMYNFDLGYVQGMSDFLSPIFTLLEDEVETFWCFAGLMEIEQETFEMQQHLMKQQLLHLSTLLKYLYPTFAAFLDAHDCGNLYFCFRWLLINFKRDFSLGDLRTLWEAFWTQKLTPYFKLFVCVAILEREKDTMVKGQFGFNEILKHVNDLAENIDLHYVLSRAESIILQLQQTENLPEEIRELVTFPDPTLRENSDESVAPTTAEINLNSRSGIEALLKEEQMQVECYDDDKETYNCDGHDMTDSAHTDSSSTIQNQNSDEAVVELREDTKAVF